MPVINGFELFNELKMKDPLTKVNFLTAFDFNSENKKKTKSRCYDSKFYKKTTCFVYINKYHISPMKEID